MSGIYLMKMLLKVAQSCSTFNGKLDLDLKFNKDVYKLPACPHTTSLL